MLLLVAALALGSGPRLSESIQQIPQAGGLSEFVQVIPRPQGFAQRPQGVAGDLAELGGAGEFVQPIDDNTKGRLPGGPEGGGENVETFQEPAGPFRRPDAELPSGMVPGRGELPIREISQDTMDGSGARGTDVRACGVADAKAKDLDLVIFGATGYLGQLTTEYLAHSPRGRRRWAIAGRDSEKLSSLFWRFRENPSLAPSEVIVAETSNVSQMSLLAKRTRVLLSLAGPYIQNEGEEVVRAAINGCAHYVDVSVEAHWMGKIISKYDKLAKARGVAVVQSAGWYSMAADFLAMSSAQAVRSYLGKDPAKVMIAWNVMNFEPPGSHIASNQADVAKYGQLHDPYVLLPEVPLSKRIDQKVDGFADQPGSGQIFGVDKQINMILEPFAPAKWSCNVVRRTMYLNITSQMVSVREAKTAQSDAEFMKYQLHRRTHRTPFGQLAPGVVGSGPDEWVRAAGMAVGTGFAYAGMHLAPHSGTSLEVAGDPLSVATPRMAMEMALALLESGPLNGQAGCLTPATAIEIQDLERRLAAIDGGEMFKIRHFTSTTVGASRPEVPLPVPS